MARRMQVREGDIIAVPFGENLVAVGIVLHVSQKLLNRSMMVGFYDHCFASPKAIDIAALGGEFIATPQYVNKRMIEGGWTIVGHSEALLAAATIPELRISADLHYKDSFIRKLAPEEWGNYPALVVQGIGSVEGTLRDHFLGTQYGC